MKINIVEYYVIVFILFLAIGCKSETKKKEEAEMPKISEKISVSGNYVSEEYKRRSEGYDWVSVLVIETDTNLLKVSVRSRADQKNQHVHLMRLPKK